MMWEGACIEWEKLTLPMVEAETAERTKPARGPLSNTLA